MSSDYDKIRLENIKEYGEGSKRHLSYLGERIYTERTHFVFELLQNAEDAGATRILFTLYKDRLEVTHDGRPFNEKDVRGVCGVREGTKTRSDLTQIGEFGIGFKSVYAYTAEPEVHSGDESFRIEHYVRPFGVKPVTIPKPWTTLFVFRFDIHPKNAYGEIDEALHNLDVKTHLFLRNIKEIKFEMPGLDTFCVYLRETSYKGPARRVKVARCINGLEDTVENWLIFSRPTVISNSSQVSVEIGFRLDTNTKSGTEGFVVENDTKLVVYFPTEKRTGLGFLIQGPYKTTLARDNVPGNDPENKELIKETAELVVESLRQLKEMALLTVPLLETLPIEADDFPEDDMFYPIYDRVRNALLNEKLIPADDGTFVTARSAKLGRSAQLMQLLDREQLRALFQNENGTKWVYSEITQNRTTGLHNYLIHELGIEEVTPGSFAYKLSESFLIGQSDDWFVRFYKFLSKQEALWQSPSWSGHSGGILRKKPIIRLQNGKHVEPFNHDDKPNAYLADGTDTVPTFPVVKTELSRHEVVRRFLKDLGIPELDVVEVVIKQVLPRYRNDLVNVIPEDYTRDLRQIGKAYETDSREKKARLQKELRKSRFILADRPNEDEKVFLNPNQVYFKSDELQVYFTGNSSFACICSDGPHAGMFRELGVADSVRIRCKSQPGSTTPVDLNGYHRSDISPSRWVYRRGKDGFDPDIEVEGLEQALDTLSLEKSQIIWNEIATQYRHCIKGTVLESSQRHNFSSGAGFYDEKEETSKFGELLIENAWLPDSSGKLHKPCELFSADLPESFIRNETLADRLGMKKDALVNLAKEAGLSGDALNIAKEYENSDELRKLVNDYLQKKTKSASADSDHGPYGEALSKAVSGTGKASTESTKIGGGTSRNTERRREKTRESITEAIERENASGGSSYLTIRKHWKGKNDTVRVSFIEWYGGRCQICGQTFIQRNGEPYFEGVYLVSHTAADWVDREGNVLCLCADHSAMFQFGPKETKKDVVQQVLGLEVKTGVEEDNLAIQMNLCGNPVEIRYAEKHLIDLQELIRVSRQASM